MLALAAIAQRPRPPPPSSGENPVAGKRNDLKRPTRRLFAGGAHTGLGARGEGPCGVSGCAAHLCVGRRPGSRSAAEVGRIEVALAAPAPLSAPRLIRYLKAYKVGQFEIMAGSGQGEEAPGWGRSRPSPIILFSRWYQGRRLGPLPRHLACARYDCSTLGRGPTRWEARHCALAGATANCCEGSEVVRRRQGRRVGKGGGSANAACWRGWGAHSKSAAGR